MSQPILNGGPGFVLLTLSVGVGAYMRLVYAGCTEIYDETISGELENLWPSNAQYTKDRSPISNMFKEI
jgi:hypothetical protein